jgi:hypothetical protein
MRACGRTRALTWPDARASRRKDVLGSEVERRGGRDWMLWFRSRWGRRRLGWRAHAPEQVCKNRIELALALPGRKDLQWRQSRVPWRDGVPTRSGAKGAKGLALTSPGKRTHGCAARRGHVRVWLHKARADACAYRRPGHGVGPERRRRDQGDNTTAAACHSDGAEKREQRPG